MNEKCGNGSQTMSPKNEEKYVHKMKKEMRQNRIITTFLLPTKKEIKSWIKCGCSNIKNSNNGNTTKSISIDYNIMISSAEM